MEASGCRFTGTLDINVQLLWPENGHMIQASLLIPWGIGAEVWKANCGVLRTLHVIRVFLLEGLER